MRKHRGDMRRQRGVARKHRVSDASTVVTCTGSEVSRASTGVTCTGSGVSHANTGWHAQSEG